MQAKKIEYYSAECRNMRRQIQAIRIKRLGWNDYVFHFIMEGMGYGTSLRELDEERLARLLHILKLYKQKGRPTEFNYDRQGRYMHHLMLGAGWEEHQLRAFMIHHYKKTHWNLLSSTERQEVIKILKENQGGKK